MQLCFLKRGKPDEHMHLNCAKQPLDFEAARIACRNPGLLNSLPGECRRPDLRPLRRIHPHPETLT